MVVRLLTKVHFFKIAHSVRYIHVSSVYHKLTQFILSDIGEGIREVTVRDWFVKVGDKVAQFDNICLVESDKASVNITSRYDGIIKRLYCEVGDTAFVGKPLVDVDTFDSDPDPPEDLTTPKKEQIIEYQNESNNKSSFKKLATPAVRRIAMEHNVSLKDVPGSGREGRVMKEDILNFLNKISKPKEILLENDEQIVPITGIKKVMSKTMTESSKIPSFCYYDDVNISKLVDLRQEIKNFAKKKGITITYMPFFIKAISKCIQMYPEMNSSLDDQGENIIIKRYHNIGIAVDTPKGLVVPNIKNVQNLSILQINHALNVLLENGRNGKLLPADMTKGTISISNIGAIGGTYAAPLINPPEVCILAVGKVRTLPVFNENDELMKSYICSLSWTADHRIIDGATMARFSNLLKEYIENPYYLMLDL